MNHFKFLTNVVITVHPQKLELLEIEFKLPVRICRALEGSIISKIYLKDISLYNGFNKISSGLLQSKLNFHLNEMLEHLNYKAYKTE